MLGQFHDKVFFSFSLLSSIFLFHHFFSSIAVPAYFSSFAGEGEGEGEGEFIKLDELDETDQSNKPDELDKSIKHGFGQSNKLDEFDQWLLS